MKILSKYKDYYDYLIGIYGEDEKICYDRRNGECISSLFPKIISGTGLVNLFIGNKVIQGFLKDDIFYWGNDALKSISIPPGMYDKKRAPHVQFFIPKPRYAYPYAITYPVLTENYNIEYVIGNVYNYTYFYSYSNDRLELLNTFKKEHDQHPVILNYENKFIYNPRLEDIGINKVIPAHDVYLAISDWHSRKITENEPSVPVGDDKVRIVNAGFDLKTSFRK